jgi:hypothetical protein
VFVTMKTVAGVVRSSRTSQPRRVRRGVGLCVMVGLCGKEG